MVRLGHHRNRPYCLVGLRSKMLDGWMGDWVIGYPLDCYYYWKTCGAKKSHSINGQCHTLIVSSFDYHVSTLDKSWHDCEWECEQPALWRLPHITGPLTTLWPPLTLGTLAGQECQISLLLCFFLFLQRAIYTPIRYKVGFTYTILNLVISLFFMIYQSYYLWYYLYQ